MTQTPISVLQININIYRYKYVHLYIHTYTYIQELVMYLSIQFVPIHRELIMCSEPVSVRRN